MKREVLIYLLSRFIPAAVGLAVIVLAIRVLGPVEYGRYSLLLYTSLIAVTLSFHWVQVSIMKFMSGMHRETNLVMSRFYDLTILSALTSTALVVVAGLWYFDLGVTELFLVGLFTFLNHFCLFHQAILQAYHRNTRSAILEGTNQVVIIAGLIAGLFLFRLNTYLLLFGAMVFSQICVLILRSLTRVKGLLTVDLKHIYWDSRFSGKVAEFGYGIALWLLFSHLLMAGDRFLIMERMGYHDAGLYSVLKDLLFKAVTFASFPIYFSYQTKVADVWNGKHKSEAWKVIKEALSFEFLIFIIVFIIFMVIKPALLKDIMRIPEADYWPLYLPVLFSAFLWQIALLLHRYLELMFNKLALLFALVATVIVNIVLNLILIPRYGLMASSVALLLTTGCYSIFLVIMALLKSRKIYAG